jgi:hypothetical protein
LRWSALTRYTDDGLLEIDNNNAERALRTVALGRKNYLFAGSNAGGDRAAVLYSLIGSRTGCGGPFTGFCVPELKAALGTVMRDGFGFAGIEVDAVEGGEGVLREVWPACLCSGRPR